MRRTIRIKPKKLPHPPRKFITPFSKNKKYKGYKTKHKHNGVTKKHKVDLKEAEIKDKKK